jgi:hypothetical protein
LISPQNGFAKAGPVDIGNKPFERGSRMSDPEAGFGLCRAALDGS